MHTYQAFGLSIHSALAFPELTATTSRVADVSIRFGKIDYPRPASNHARSYCHASETAALCSWDEIGDFWIHGGAEIVIDESSISPKANEDRLRLLILGPVFAILLYQRGFLVLHASAIACDGSAIAFVGAKGQGKSTIAASLYARGHCLLADDVVVLGGSREDECDEPLTVLPSFPQFKLWPDAVASILGDDPQSLPPIMSGYDKRARRIGDGFSLTPVPVRQLYVLDWGSAPAIKQLSAREALVGMMGHSYIARFGREFLHGNETIRHLRQCTRLVQSVPIHALEHPRSLTAVSEVARLIEERNLRSQISSNI
jgi:hypothetical protein